MHLRDPRRWKSALAGASHGDLLRARTAAAAWVAGVLARVRARRQRAPARLAAPQLGAHARLLVAVLLCVTQSHVIHGVQNPDEG